MKAEIKVLESALYTYLAEIGTKVSDARIALADGKEPEAEEILGSLEHDLMRQLDALEWKDDPVLDLPIEEVLPPGVGAALAFELLLHPVGVDS